MQNSEKCEKCSWNDHDVLIVTQQMKSMKIKPIQYFTTRSTIEFKIKGEVENTRLKQRTQKKSKAKTKNRLPKNRPSLGQGQNFQGQGKDQGHNFASDLQKYVFAQKIANFRKILDALQKKRSS